MTTSIPNKIVIILISQLENNLWISWGIKLGSHPLIWIDLSYGGGQILGTNQKLLENQGDRDASHDHLLQI